MSSFSSTDPSLAALADSARFVSTAGAEARQIMSRPTSVTAILGRSMHRTRAGNRCVAASWATFP